MAARDRRLAILNTVAVADRLTETAIASGEEPWQLQRGQALLAVWDAEHPWSSVAAATDREAALNAYLADMWQAAYMAGTADGMALA